MDRLDFIDKIGCQSDMNKHFDALMSAYDVLNNCTIEDIQYNNSDSLVFTLSSSNVKDVDNITSYLSRVMPSGYGKQFDLNVERKETIIKLTINDRAPI